MIQIQERTPVEGRIVSVKYARKVDTLKGINEQFEEFKKLGFSDDGDFSNNTKVVERVTLSVVDYDILSKNLLSDHNFLKGCGGRDMEGYIHAIEIVSEGRKTFYINPEGYSYARYVGFAS